MDEEQLLAILASERQNSIGFEHDDELADARERALNYYKGEMPDVLALPNRSKAVSTAVADAIETIVPDLVEIFTGEDVATFTPIGPEDEDSAAQETDYIRHVVFDQNPGFLVLSAMFRDACLTKTGVVKWWWDEPIYADDEVFENRTAMEAQSLQQYGLIVDVAEQEASEGQAEPLYTITLRQVAKKGRIRVRAVPPEDFTVGRDTVWLPEATYCAIRARRRAQDLIGDGVAEDIVDQLSAYSDPSETLERARDSVDESDEEVEGVGNLRMVEVVEHYIRIDGELHRVLTGNDEKVLISQEVVDQIQVAAITPYMITHRFYGESVADKLIEIQRIQTALTRMALDSGYFALNQRMGVDMSKANEWTLSDLMRNEPMMPIRMSQAGAVTPIQSAGLGFDAFAALEYFETMGEKRTGIVRNANGLNPDTLHDTARGMQSLVNAAQKRVRYIARVFAETGVKDMFVGVHALVRKHVSQAEKVRLRGKWAEADPTRWGSRHDMTIEIGLGSSGREAELMALRGLGDIYRDVIEMQGGQPTGPYVTPQNLYVYLQKITEKSGLRSPELFWSDPSQQAQPQQPEQPEGDPAAAEATAQMQMEQQKLQMRMEADQFKAQSDLAIAREKMAAEMELQRYKIDADIDLKARQLEAELTLKRELAMMGAQAPGPHDVHMGGEPG